MWLVNKTYNHLSELIDEAKNYTVFSTITEKSIEATFMPIYMTYELAVKDFPYKDIIELK